jgi:Uma2 family endonuclease
MIEAGILGENDRVELVDGWIVEMSPIGPPHMTCVSLIVAALQQRLPPGWNVRIQGPVTLPNSEPEPDVTVVRGGIRDYRNRHPSINDIALVVEVADATLQFDRIQKRAQYALAEIPEYWIVNLIDRCLELHRNPARGDYRTRDVLNADASVNLFLAGQIVASIPIIDILP